MLVGRDAELRRIEGLLADARAGRAGGLVMVGEPGVGKSALLRYAGEAADGMLVLAARGVEAEAALDYAGLSQLLRPVLDRADRLIAPQRRALLGAVGAGPDRAHDRFIVFVATLSLLAEVAEDRPVLALVDDGHWLDPPSRGALGFVIRRLTREKLAVLVSLRTGASLRLPEQVVDGLDAVAAGALVETVAHSPIADTVRDQIHRHTGGNPLALRELARLLTPAQLRGSEPLPEPLPMGTELVQAFGARILAHAEPTRRALVIAAAHGSGELGTLARALRARGLDVSALVAAESAGLVHVESGRLEFDHPLFRSAAYHSAPPPERRDAHAALVDALDASSQRAARAWHLAAATLEPTEDVARELESVAEDVQLDAAPGTAAGIFESAARLSPAAHERARRLLAAGRARHLAGDGDAALRLLEEALLATDDPLTRADIQHTRAHVVAVRGPAAGIRAMLIAEADRVEPVDPARAAAMLLDAASVSIMLGEPPETLRLAERTFPAAERAGGVVAQMAALLLGAAYILCGDAVRGERLLARAEPLLHSSQPSVFGVAGAQLAMSLLWVERFEDARRLLADIVVRLRTDGAATALPYAMTGLAFAQQNCGEWRTAHATAAEAVELAETVGQTATACMARVAAAMAIGGQGRAGEARAYLDHAIDKARELGIASMRTMEGWIRGQVELGVGNYEAAIAVLEPTGRLTLAAGLEEPGIAFWAQDLAEAYIRADRAADAEPPLEVLERQAERTGRRLAHAGVARCRGLLAGADEFETYFDRALGWHDCVACPFERARTELCFGERLRRARRRKQAREPLRSALATFEALGAEPWAERTRVELRATGERVRRRSPDTIDTLTPQELQVSLLIADGATNREAAATLFVTTKTIETHLHHIYKKLGIRSRIELARRLRDAPDVARIVQQ